MADACLRAGEPDGGLCPGGMDHPGARRRGIIADCHVYGGIRIYVARRLPFASRQMTPLKDGAVLSLRLRWSAPATPRRMRRGHFPSKANSKLHIDRPCQSPGSQVARTAPGFRLRAAQRRLIVVAIRESLGAAPFGGSITEIRRSLMLRDDCISREGLPLEIR